MRTTPELIFGICMMALGASGFAVVVGNMAALLGKMDLRATAFKERMEDFDDFMHQENLPLDLRFRSRSVRSSRVLIHWCHFPRFSCWVLQVFRELLKPYDFHNSLILSSMSFLIFLVRAVISCQMLRAFSPSRLSYALLFFLSLGGQFIDLNSHWCRVFLLELSDFREFIFQWFASFWFKTVDCFRVSD